MKVSIHQPQYIPWLPYILKIEESNLFIILDSVDFQKNGIQNRNMIKTAQGAQWLTVPIKQKLGQKINETEINNSLPWRKKHWSSIITNYSRAPYFKKFGTDLEAVYLQEWTNLAEFNITMLELILTFFKVKSPVLKSSEMKAVGKGSDLVLNLCKEAGATTYISGTGGMGYLNQQAFVAENIELIFQSAQLPRPYNQLFPSMGFIADLTCLDILFNCGDTWNEYVKNGNKI